MTELENKVFQSLKLKVERVFGRTPDELVYTLNYFLENFPEFLQFYNSLEDIDLYSAINLFLIKLKQEEKIKYSIVTREIKYTSPSLWEFLISIIAVSCLSIKKNSPPKSNRI